MNPVEGRWNWSTAFASIPQADIRHGGMLHLSVGPGRKRPIGPASPGCFRLSPFRRRIVQMGEAQYLPFPAFGESRGRSPLVVFLFASVFLCQTKKNADAISPWQAGKGRFRFSIRRNQLGFISILLLYLSG